MGKQCLICGENGFLYYPFCKRHLDMKSEGKIIKCENCGKWHLADEKCECQKQQNNTAKPQKTNEHEKKYTELPTSGFDKCVSCGEKTNGYAFCKKCWSNLSEEEMLNILNEKTNTKPKEQTQNKLTISENEPKCITCGKITNGYLFCKDCYSKYKNKELLFRITNCTEVELLDDSYEGVFTCEDGHIVKSKSERTIDDYLFEHKIPHAYERALSIDADPKHDLHPDFCLPNFDGKGIDVYIEHWGYNENNIQYTKTKKYKIPIYKQNNITIICTNENDMKDPKTALARKLKFYKEDEVNFDE